MKTEEYPKIETQVFCQLHRVTFGCSKLPDNIMQKCPICAHKEIEQLRDDLCKNIAHKNALIFAFEIKKEAMVTAITN